VASSLGTLVVLFGQDGADEANESVAVGEDPDDVSAAADLPVQVLGRVVRPDLAPDLFREVGERQDVCPRCVEVLGDLREFSATALRTRSNWACTEVASGWS
jgi:hypothetical protein